MADQAFNPFVNQIVYFLGVRPIPLPWLKIPEMELTVRFELDSFVRGVNKRQNRLGRHIVDDVSRRHGVSRFSYGANVAGQIDIRNDSLPPIEPDRHEELHVPAFAVATVLMDFIQPVAPILPFQNSAFIITKCPA